MMKNLRNVFIVMLINLLVISLLRVPMAAGQGQQPDSIYILEGTWDCRRHRTTVFHIKNPNPRPIFVMLLWYYDNEQPAAIHFLWLSPNDVAEVDARFALPQYGYGRWGNVTMIGFHFEFQNSNNAEVVQVVDKIVGFQKEVFSSQISISTPNPGPVYSALAVGNIYGLTEANLAEATLSEEKGSESNFLTKILAKSRNDGILYDGILYDVEVAESLCENIGDDYIVVDLLKKYTGIYLLSPHGIDRPKPVTSPLPKCK